MNSQKTPLVVCPFTGQRYIKSYTAAEIRTAWPERVWQFDPWFTTRRKAEDIASDPLGLAILEPYAPLLSILRIRLSEGRRVEDFNPTTSLLDGDLDYHRGDIMSERRGAQRREEQA
jgi:hypothetical protein